MTTPFFLNREDLLISDFWSSALGGYHLAQAGGGQGGSRAWMWAKQGIQLSLDDVLLHRVACMLGSNSDFPLTTVCLLALNSGPQFLYLWNGHENVHIL